MSRTVKNGLNLKKMGHCEKWVHLEKRVTLYKMGHIVGEMGHTVKYELHCKSGSHREQLITFGK